MTNKPTSLEKMNQTLRDNGVEVVVITDKEDVAPEATAYFEYRKGKGERDAKKLDRLRSAHLRNFYKHIAKIYPHLLFEAQTDELFFNYNKETGVYDDWKRVHVQELITRELVNNGFLTEATSSRVNQTIVLMRSMFGERGCHYDDFDSQTKLFHCSNGWVHLDLEPDGKDEKGLLKYKDRVFEGHNPKLLSRRVSAVPYDAKAECPNYDKMLTDYQLADDQVRVIKQFSGLLLTDEIKHQKMLVFVGKPGCGKSTIAEIWGKVLGGMAEQKALTDLTSDKARFMGKSLVGKTFLHLEEAEVKRSEMGSTLGSLVTGNKITVERKGKDEDPQVQNKLKCVLTANSLPMSAEAGIFRRMIMISFTNSFYDNETADLLLPEKLEKEHSGILNRMLEGLKDIRRAGTFTLIVGHAEAIEQYKVSSNTIAEYLDEYYDPGTWEETVSSNVVFNTYVKWMGKNIGRMILTPQRFGQMLKAQPLKKFDIESKRGTAGARLRTGLKIKPCYREVKSEEVLEINTSYIPPGGTVPVSEDW